MLKAASLGGLEARRLGQVWEAEETTDKVPNSPRSTAAPATSVGKPGALQNQVMPIAHLWLRRQLLY